MKNSKSEHRDYSLASFRIMSDELEPTEITALLEIEPDVAHKKGDQDCVMSKKGTVRYRAPYRSGLWAIRSRLDKFCRLHDHVANLLNCIELKRDALAKLKDRGFKLDIYIGHNFMDEAQPGMSLASDTLKRMGDLGIDLNIDLYGR